METKWTDWIECDGGTIVVKAIPPNCVAIELEFRGRERQTMRYDEPTTEWTDLNLSSNATAYRLLVEAESSVELFPTLNTELTKLDRIAIALNPNIVENFDPFEMQTILKLTTKEVHEMGLLVFEAKARAWLRYTEATAMLDASNTFAKQQEQND
jgi:hypothetical protein